MLGRLPGDHPGCQAVWLDDQAAQNGPCGSCHSLRTLRRERANYSTDLPIHRHIVTVCLDCEQWSIDCVAALDQHQQGPR